MESLQRTHFGKVLLQTLEQAGEKARGKASRKVDGSLRIPTKVEGK